ncbi:ATP-dependent DNA ligase [Streptomyces xiamenensis]|uniref:ATP-dependent DNA ligase n=1 Tax=Streptomyces xiamenensis TaxID=408015 RepID=UPI0035E34B77
MLTAATTRLPPWGAYAAEPKWDGFRALLGRWSDGRVSLRSRQGTEMSTWFPELTAAIVPAPPAGNLLLDGEVVAWAEDRLDFGRLLSRVNASPASAARIAAAQPCHFVAFDLLHLRGAELIRRPYRHRRATLEKLFDEKRMPPLFQLSPSSSDPADALQWLDWSVSGIEGLVFKRLDQSYLPGRRGWLKWRLRQSTEAIIGAVTGPPARPATALLGRLDPAGRLHFVGRTTTLATPIATELGWELSRAGTGHPWQTRTFAAGWGRPEPLEVTLVKADLVVEISADTAIDAPGRWRHPVRLLRPRPDLSTADVPAFGSRNDPAAG